MKYRSDFVTNSSSSSFIIQTNEEIPEEMKPYFPKITTVEDILQWFDIYDAIEEEKLQELTPFSKEQLAIIQAIHCHVFDEFATLYKAWKENKGILYSFCVDRDWFYDKIILRDFIRDHLFMEGFE